MKREYVAFVEGRPRTSTGTWRQWLQLSRDELRQHVLSEKQLKGADSEAREAITRYEVIAEYPLVGGRGFVTKLRLWLETGRKHQIRVQAAHAGLPLIGDRTYNPAYREPDGAPTRIDFPRQASHELDRRIAQRPSPARNRLALLPALKSPMESRCCL
jgi:23S rRNA pseudouridine1911/1915/1917 synthase